MMKRTPLETPDRKERAASARSKLHSVGITLTYMSGYWASRDAVSTEQIHESIKAANPVYEATKYPGTGSEVFKLMCGPLRVTVTVEKDIFVLQQGLHKEELKTISFDTLKKAVLLISNRIKESL